MRFEEIIDLEELEELDLSEEEKENILKSL